MNKIEIVKKIYGLMEQGNFEEAKSYLLPGFQLLGAPPHPMGKEEWMDFQKNYLLVFLILNLTSGICRKEEI